MGKGYSQGLHTEIVDGCWLDTVVIPYTIHVLLEGPPNSNWVDEVDLTLN